MIHSLAGGDIREKKMFTFCKVEILSGESCGKMFWYLSDIFGLKEGDLVFVPLGIKNTSEKGKVVRVVSNVTTDRAPIPTKLAKYILKKLDN